ncbi:PepSY-associated TM helix domain-containing protein [Azotobacter salinestris]|uniref:PepSY-associated TM helix domain-containing protein n=1 Tax=Azotobacter salinestris TaxID=69964 RepID=UPI0032DF1CDE
MSLPGLAGAARGGRWRIDRPLLVLIHRYVGLTMAGFLLVAGLTGSLLAWNEELEAVLSPALFRVAPPGPEARPLDPLVLRARVQELHPQAFVARAPLKVEPGHSVTFRLFARPDASGSLPELANDQVFVNPYTGEVLGARKWGDISQGPKNLMPFLYRLHFSLALGSVGSYLLGIVALLWTLDCFAGAYLTFPARQRNRAQRTPGKGWLARWWSAWQVRWTGGSYKLNFDLHRAGGLWPWAMLFVLAWSSVAFNLSEVYDPVMETLFAHQPDGPASRNRAAPQLEPRLDWFEARETGRRLMAREAQAQGFAVQWEDALTYDPRRGLYSYRVHSDRDLSQHWGSTQVSFDANSGALAYVWLPTGAASGDTLRTWFVSLHMAALWGLPFRLFVCLLGLVVAMLSVTGTLIWWRKRQGRLKMEGKRAAESASIAHAARLDGQ